MCRTTIGAIANRAFESDIYQKLLSTAAAMSICDYTPFLSKQSKARIPSPIRALQ
eukprot:gene6895-7590_t